MAFMIWTCSRRSYLSHVKLACPSTALRTQSALMTVMSAWKMFYPNLYGQILRRRRVPVHYLGQPDWW